jgi:hypothetical protein
MRSTHSGGISTADNMVVACSLSLRSAPQFPGEGAAADIERVAPSPPDQYVGPPLGTPHWSYMARSLPKAAASEVNRSPVRCVPSPDHPSRITTGGEVAGIPSSTDTDVSSHRFLADSGLVNRRGGRRRCASAPSVRRRTRRLQRSRSSQALADMLGEQTRVQTGLVQDLATGALREELTGQPE